MICCSSFCPVQCTLLGVDLCIKMLFIQVIVIQLVDKTPSIKLPTLITNRLSMSFIMFSHDAYYSGPQHSGIQLARFC